MKAKTVRAKLKRREPFATCDRCGKDIHYGNAGVTFSRCVEQVDSTAEYPDGESTVIDSNVLISLCPSCGNRFSTERVREILMAALGQPLHTQN